MSKSNDGGYCVDILARPSGSAEVFRPRLVVIYGKDKPYEETVQLAKDKVRRDGFEVLDVLSAERLTPMQLASRIGVQRTTVRLARTAFLTAEEGVRRAQAERHYLRAVETMEAYDDNE